MSYVRVLKPGLSHVVASGESGVINAASAEYSDVAAAVALAEEGNTVNVPAGEATWASQLVLNTSIILSGAGIGSTVITNGIGADFLIKMIPSVPADNPYIEVTGFTFDGDSVGSCITIYAEDDTYEWTNFRIHHNKMMNTPNVSNAYMSIRTKGNCFGLIDNNQFENNYYDFKIYGNDQNSWDKFPGEENMGTVNFLYIEDNTSINVQYFELTSGEGARWVFRYNTINVSNIYTVLDAHGNTNNDGVVGFEAYENTYLSNSALTRMNDVRGGTGIIYNNTCASNDCIIDIREEDAYQYTPIDETYPGTDPISNTYLFNNINTYTSAIIRIREWDNQENNLIEQNRDYWTDATVKDYFSGEFITKDTDFTYGLFANRPASPGEDDCYWATDTKELYRCESEGEWTLVYEPYAYPHPLRGE